MEISKCFKIGYVVKPHGLKGEVTLALSPECPHPGSLHSVFFEVKNQLVPYFIIAASVKGTRAYIKLEEVNTPEMAASLKGCSLYLPKTKRPKLAHGEFYGDEIVGFEVVDLAIGVLGEVNEVLENGANRHLLIIRQSKEIMIPITGPFIKSISKVRKKIMVELPDGFLEI